jgi:hypothetical protein
MMRNGVGLYEEFAHDSFNDQNDGGNFEVMAGNNSLGNSLGSIVMGQKLASSGDPITMNQEIIDFLVAQGVQDVIYDIDLSWMLLGHIDEVISFATSPDGRARVASPEAAYALLLHAKQNLLIPGSQQIFSGINQGIVNNSWEYLNTTLNEVISLIQNNYLFFFGSNSYAEKIRTNVIDRFGLDARNYTIRSALGGIPINPLAKIGYLEGNDHFGGGRMVEWRLEFTSNTEYNLYYRKDGTNDPWIYDGTGNRNADFISNTGMVYILKTWWGYATTAGQGVIFATYPSPDIIEMPVLFTNYDAYNTTVLNNAKVFTNNVINSLVDGNTLFCPFVFGPHVDSTDPSTSVFNNYVSYVVTKDYLGKNEEGSIVLKSSDISNVSFCDDRVYHRGTGSLHCATNVLRKIPQLGSGKEWWELFD